MIELGIIYFSYQPVTMTDVQVYPGLATDVNFTLFPGSMSAVQQIKWLPQDVHTDKDDVEQPEIELAFRLLYQLF